MGDSNGNLQSSGVNRGMRGGGRRGDWRALERRIVVGQEEAGRGRIDAAADMQTEPGDVAGLRAKARQLHCLRL
jgi:hypothetical protein